MHIATKKAEYLSPECTFLLLKTECSLLVGSTEGGGGNENYAPPFSNPFEDFDPSNIPGFPSFPF